MTWSLFQLDVIFHHYCSSGQFREGDYPPIYEGEVANLVAMGVLEEGPDGGRPYVTTKLGNALVRLIESTPLPIEVFVDPRDLKPIDMPFPPPEPDF